VVVLEAIGIRKHFGGVIALSNANLRCYQGRITGLLGANGSGKSTMSKIICGVYQPDGGEIRYKGKVVKYRSPSEARRDGIAMVFQNLSLVADLTVWQNIVLGNEEAKSFFLDDDSAKELSRKILAQLLPDLDIDKKVSQLNPGEMQIVEIAKAVSQNPQLLILDEPTAALEQAQVRNLFSYMRTLAKEGVAMIFTSHRLWEVMEICDDVTIFRNGENVASIDFEKEEKDPEKIIGYITGDVQKKKVEGKREKVTGEIVLKVKNLNYSRSLKNISFDLKKGEILGIGGLAGQGQIELMHALAGAFRSVRGDVELKGKKIRLNRPLDAIKEGVVFVPGDKHLEGLFLTHSVLFNMIFPKTGLPRHPLFIPYEDYRKECEEIVNILSIKTPTVDVPVETLSGGNQQKVVVGKWLPFDINVLLLADPAKGIDIGAKRDLYQYIVERVQENNMSVILYASDNEELIEYCDRVLIMYEGQIVESLEGEDINEDTIIACSMRVR